MAGASTPVSKIVGVTRAMAPMYSDRIDLHDAALTVAGRGSFMRPVVVGRCCGWLHGCGEAMGGDVAVLLCPGLNRDLVDAHHALRMLGNDLAAAGYPTMRLDYPGIGDSADPAGDDPFAVEYWSAWQQSLHAALDWLRATTGARHVVLCGLRIGATLASLVAEKRDDVKALILLAPVLKGRTYIQQLHMQARLQRQHAPPLTSGLEFYDVRFGAETVDLISAVDLRRARLAAGLRVAMFEQSPSRLGSECAGAWSERGVEVFCTDFAGLEPALRHNEETEGTPADFSRVMAWLQTAIPARPMPLAGASWPAPSLAQPGWIETPQRFGEDDRLFGVLCCPDGRASDMAVIIGNAGRDPRYSVSRFSVEFARHLASLGVASLRIDFAGLGDSIGPPGKESVLTSMFGTDRTGDLAAAVDRLQQLGYRRIAVHGNCAGAYHGLRGALADPRIDTLLLLNLPVFEWHDGDTVDFVYRKTMKPGRYLVKVGSRDTWGRLLRGSLDLGGILHAQYARQHARLREAGLRLAERLGWIGPQGGGRHAMAVLARRGAKTLLLFSAHDNGLDMMEQEFGQGFAGLRAFAGADLRIAHEADHLLSTRAMRQAAIQIMAQFLAERL
jgi:alpha/beta superfamily hydrolase